jgi:hypothetical protein
MLMVDIQDSDLKKKYLDKDFLNYRAGGGFIENLANKLKNNPNSHIDKIKKEDFTEVCDILVNENNKCTTYDKKKDLHGRRKLKLFHRCVMVNYYNTHVSNKLLDDIFSIEHLIPYSSKWGENELVDIDRIGNLVPVYAKLNSGRGNRNIKYYYKQDNAFITQLEMIPTVKDYDNIVDDNKSPVIKNIEAYNMFCEKNEEIYVNSFIENVFS